AGHPVDEDQVLQVLDDQGLPLVGQGKIDGPAGEEDLLASRLETLVGRDHDAAVWLPADVEPLLLIGLDTSCSHGQGHEERKNARTEHEHLLSPSRGPTASALLLVAIDPDQANDHFGQPFSLRLVWPNDNPDRL